MTPRGFIQERMKDSLKLRENWGEVVDYEVIEQSSWDLLDSWKRVRSRWGHSLHTICSRTGSFPPRLVHYFISLYSKPEDLILDPYAGKGTTILESCLLGRKGIGNDACPDAYVLTLAKAKPPTKHHFMDYLLNLKKRMTKANVDDAPENVRIYFHDDTLAQILAIREVINDDSRRGYGKRDEKLLINVTFIKALMLGILHGRATHCLSLPLPHSFAMSPGYVKKKVQKDPKEYRKPKKNLIKCLTAKANLVFKDSFNENFIMGDSLCLDAAQLNFEDPVDLIITSPPYLDAHTYAWDNWLRLWFLGFDYREVRSSLMQSGSEKVYLKHMETSLKNMYEILKQNSRCFIVVGDVKGHQPTAYLIGDLIKSILDLGFRLHKIIVDDIKPTRRYLYGDNNRIGISTDRIMELHKGNPPTPKGRVYYDYVRDFSSSAI